MPWNLFLFPLLGGFLFLHVCKLFRYRSQRFEGERLLLQSTSYGVLLGIFGRLGTFWLSRFPIGQQAQAFLDHLISPKDAPYLGTAIAALLIGWGSAHVINGVVAIFDNRRIKLMVVGRYDDGLLRMLYIAMYEGKPVSITLSHRKVYIGYVFEAPGDSPYNRYLTLMLLLSGYRSEASLSFVETTNYANRTILAETAQKSQIFTITIPMQDIISANEFDRQLYEQEFAEKLVS